MAKQNDALFEESSRGAIGAVTALGFILSFVLVVGGMVLFSYGFDSGSDQRDMWIFVGGLSATMVGLLLPFAWLPAIGK